MKHAHARNDARETMGMDAGARGGERKAAYSAAPSPLTTGAYSRCRMRYTSPGRNLGMAQTLGDRLRAVRRRLGVSQVELAEKSGVAQQSISRVERNERLYLRSDVLVRLVKALGVSADELLGTEPDK
jgi:DNA-binding XRE family transcriptional regulator